MCSACNDPKTFARGLCQACYTRLRRNGTVERKNVRGQTHCIHPGCTQESFAKNLCTPHYMQAQHPMKNTWKLLRSRNPGQYPLSWDRFDAFLADVGTRPSPKHQLRRHNDSAPFSAANIAWKEPIKTGTGYDDPLHQAKYGREWSLRKKYGIDGAEYQRLHDGQDGLCAICNKPEMTRGRNGRPRRLNVDHNHSTGAVRGLLCVPCNRGVGHFLDSQDLLRSAIAYLDHHAR